MMMRVLLFLVVTVVSHAAGQAHASCRATPVVEGKKFVCADGTIQLISLEQSEVIIKTFNPESRSWSEQRFPAIDGLSLEQVSVAVQASG